MASIELRTLIDNILQDISRDMRAQADCVERALTVRIGEMDDARAKLSNNLTNVLSCLVFSLIFHANKKIFGLAIFDGIFMFSIFKKK